MSNKIITKQKSNKTTKVKLLGITIYKKTKKPDLEKIYIIGIPFYAKKKRQLSEKEYFLGICYHNIKHLPSNNLQTEAITKHLNQIKNDISLKLDIITLHQKTFSKFKNINTNKDIVIVGAGPSLKYYKPYKNAIHIGVNRTFLFNQINLDYLFLLDYPNVKPYIKQANEYRKEKCKKFYGLFSEKDHNMHIPDSEAFSAQADRYYISENGYNLNEEFIYNIEQNPLACFWSVIFQAAQFSLYTNPKRLFIVGCDCNFNGYYDGQQQSLPNRLKDKHTIRNMDGWKKLKKYADLYYPETEIISINPVGLKGLFKDVYTQEYLNEHPEIDNNKINILEEF